MKLLKLDSRRWTTTFRFPSLWAPSHSILLLSNFFPRVVLSFWKIFVEEFYILPLNLSPAILFLPTIKYKFSFQFQILCLKILSFFPLHPSFLDRLRKELASKTQGVISRIKNWKLEAREANVPRLARKDLHRPYVYHALLHRSCNLPAHYSTVYQRFRPSTTPPSTSPLSLCVFLSIYSPEVLSGRRDLPLPGAPPSLRFFPADLSAPLIRIYRGRIFSPKGPTCF